MTETSNMNDPELPAAGATDDELRALAARLLARQAAASAGETPPEPELGDTPLPPALARHLGGFAAAFRERRPELAGSAAGRELARVTFDLTVLGRRDEALRLARAAAEHADDPALPDALRYHEVAHAIRHARDAGDALAWLRAAGLALPPTLILFGGLPATGKTWASDRLALVFGTVAEHSDRVRKLLAGLPLERHTRSGYDTGLYAASAKERTYRTMADTAERTLRLGGTAVSDATFTEVRWRAPFVDVAESTGASLLLVELTAPLELIEERMAERARHPEEVSDADLSVYLRMREEVEPPDELPADSVLRVDTRVPTDEMRGLVLERALELATAAGWNPGAPRTKEGT
jgi:predicted kinase